MPVIINNLQATVRDLPSGSTDGIRVYPTGSTEASRQGTDSKVQKLWDVLALQQERQQRLQTD